MWSGLLVEWCLLLSSHCKFRKNFMERYLLRDIRAEGVGPSASMNDAGRRPFRGTRLTLGGVLILATIIFASMTLYLTNSASPTTASLAVVPDSSVGPPIITVNQQSLGYGSAFSPANITVSAGTTVTWVVQDSASPVSIQFTRLPPDAGPISSSPSLGQGGTFSVFLTSPGTYTYGSTLVSGWTTGTIVVTG